MSVRRETGKEQAVQVGLSSRLRPFKGTPRQMIFREGLVEGDAVRVLRIGQCAVHIKYDGFDRHGIGVHIVQKNR